MPNCDFWSKQRVFLTGHTGFKGSWTALWLARMGAQVHGYSLAPETAPNLHDLIGNAKGMTSTIGDIRDPLALQRAVDACDPTVAIHMAAQPLVRRSYREPAETYDVNVMGTLHVLNTLRRAPRLRAILVVTTDKVYMNDDSGRPFVETDPLGGHDPYSSSKAACEELVSCYRQSYFEEAGIRVATARAGNVVGGGDWSEDRLIPDIWRAMLTGQPVTLRNPGSTRPWQHVLDPVSGYLDYVEALASDGAVALPNALNLAPATDSPMSVQAVTETLGEALGMRETWRLDEGDNPVEMTMLTLDASLATRVLGWHPRLTGRQAVEWSADWYIRQHQGQDATALTLAQIDEYEGLATR
ncbi:CDP-glucose 4,6-dehydratase [Stenotrophomonas rhizophila]|uniref:CDP-glucose 4,6-dehydratase n=1 Tax=Stenotrophomonas rhizophila TaxID=216778 RepID=UPI00112F38A8|nr:CDP-glucose 4,6-dehydratase [Stenotrophomonas rhizophila]